MGPISEAFNLTLFKLTMRSGGLCYILNVVAQRWYPFILYDCIRNESRIEEIKKHAPCAKDMSCLTVHEFYGSDFGDGASNEEPIGGVQESDTNTASSERLHGEILRRHLTKVLGHAQSV